MPLNGIAPYLSHWSDWNPAYNPRDQWFKKTYELGIGGGERWCVDKHGWMKGMAVTSLLEKFKVELSENDTRTIDLKRGEKFEHVIVGAPENDPNQWIIGWEDLSGGGDTDHNDVVFRIERKTGGEATLTEENAIKASETDNSVYFTRVNLEVWDVMPCGGKTQINYQISPDNGTNWIDVLNTDWDVVKCMDLSDESVSEVAVDEWSPGYSDPACTDDTVSPSPATYRSISIDLINLGMVGKNLRWRAVFNSENEQCVPEILNVKLTGSVTSHATFSRAQTVAQANLLYSGAYQTPDIINDDEWKAEPELHGLVTATRLYDPEKPRDKNKSLVDISEAWEAGILLSQKTADQLGDRKIYYPDLTATYTSGETVSLTEQGTKTFKGTLSDTPISAGSVRIALSVDGVIEYYEDMFTNRLVGDNDGFGSINRHTGEFEITLYNTPETDAVVTATAAYVYLADGDEGLVEFKNTNVTQDLLGLRVRSMDSFDFNEDGHIDDDDRDILIDWVRGIKADGTARYWPLGAVDHSTPALQTPPGKPAWLKGTSVPSDMKSSYDNFREANQERQTVLYVGARDGMLHAFDAGEFRWGDNPETADDYEKRGYFLWDENDVPQYGTGEELWAFIPGSLLSKLRNNFIKKEDQAAIDASPTVADIYDGSDWKTVVISALGSGGDSVFCLDVTDPASPGFMWEFTDPALLRSRSSPSVAAVGQIVDNEGNPAWAAFIVSGKVATDSFAKIFVINIATGEKVSLEDSDGNTITEIELDADSDGTGSIASGQPAMVDSDNNGFVDRLYIGTNMGNMYKVVLPDDPGGGGQVCNCVVNSDFDYQFEENDVVKTETVSDLGNGIYASPAVVVDEDPTTGENVVRIFFGTGDSPYAADDINTGNTKFHFFAYTDRSESGLCEGTGSSDGTCGETELEWFYEMPAGERTWASAFAAAGKIYFGTSTRDTEDPCEGYEENDTTTGQIYVFDKVLVDDAAPTATQVDVGSDINVGPVVYDKHILVKQPTGKTSVVGSGQFNNEVKTIISGQSNTLLWREVNTY
jgi:hypothetical protein